MERLLRIQQELKAPKKQFNAFAKYNYRSCEDILEALKPVLNKYECVVILSDKIITVLNRVYVEVTATLYSIDGKEIAHSTASAREPDTKKGSDESQITGAASSYARKYALNGLFGIDDTKDADTMDNRDYTPKAKANPDVIKQINGCKNLNALSALYEMLSQTDQAKHKAAFTKRKMELANANN